jgi:hypothetical protein
MAGADDVPDEIAALAGRLFEMARNGNIPPSQK